MKKTYVKPKMGFESFELSTNIAGTCDKSAGHTVTDCVNVPGVDEGLFGNACIVPVVCYHVPSEGDNVFAS